MLPGFSEAVSVSIIYTLLHFLTSQINAQLCGWSRNYRYDKVPKISHELPTDINWHKCFHFITQGFGLGWFSLTFFVDLFCVQSTCIKQREYATQQATFKLSRSFFFTGDLCFVQKWVFRLQSFLNNFHTGQYSLLNSGCKSAMCQAESACSEKRLSQQV